jgi:hypothetical protein
MGSIIGTIAQIRHEHYQRVVAGEPVETDEDSAVREWWNSTGALRCAAGVGCDLRRDGVQRAGAFASREGVADGDRTDVAY